MEQTKNPIQLWFADFPEQILDVIEFSVRETISGTFTVSAIAETPHHDLDFEALIDRGAGLSLQAFGDQTRVWTGICAQIRHETGHHAGVSRYQLLIVPELYRLRLRKNSRIFQDLSIPEIVLKVLAGWEIEPELRNFDAASYDRFPKFEYRVQYEESDYAFISRLLEEAGISFHFEYANKLKGKGRELTKLVLDSDPQEASDPEPEENEDDDSDDESDDDGEEDEDEDDSKKRVRGPLNYLGNVEDPGSRGFQLDSVLNAGITRNVRVGAVTIIDHDFRRELGFRAAAEAKLTDASEGKYEHLTYVPGALQTADPVTGDRYDEAYAKQVARDEYLSIRGQELVSFFLTNALDVCPGTVLQFGKPTSSTIEHDRNELGKDKKHLVIETSIEHGTRTGNWLVKCRAVPAEEPFRPARITPKPRITGVQSALVVGDELEVKEEIHCDNFGRVKVQFHWDRQHKYGQPVPGIPSLASCWVRVATPWAGSGYGFVALPRVGHEVLVSFLDGDPDRPVIVGSVYNQFNPVPYPLPANKTRTGLKSNTRGGFNELYFEDKKGSELVHMQAERNLSTVVKAQESRDVHAGRTSRIGAEDKLHVGEKFELAVGTHETGIMVHENTLVIIQVGGADGAQVMLSGTGIYLQAKSDIHLHAGADIHLSAMGQIKMDGGTVHINDGSAEAVELPPYSPAAKPVGGLTLDPGPKPKGGGGMPLDPSRLPADVTLEEERVKPEVAPPSVPPVGSPYEDDIPTPAAAMPTATGLAPGVAPGLPAQTPAMPAINPGQLAAMAQNPGGAAAALKSGVAGQVAGLVPGAPAGAVAALAGGGNPLTAVGSNLAGGLAQNMAPGIPGIGGGVQSVIASGGDLKAAATGAAGSLAQGLANSVVPGGGAAVGIGSALIQGGGNLGAVAPALAPALAAQAAGAIVPGAAAVVAAPLAGMAAANLIAPKPPVPPAVSPPAPAVKPPPPVPPRGTPEGGGGSGGEG